MIYTVAHARADVDDNSKLYNQKKYITMRCQQRHHMPDYFIGLQNVTELYWR